MKTDFRALRPVHNRRGVTLIEMLVACALLVLMMTIIVQVFGAATGAVSTQRVYQELDTNLRQVDAMLRQDLANVTARFTPPLDPKNNLGYFEYIENSLADNQGEDADDCLRFTAKAPEGQVFTGRMYVQPAYPVSLTAPRSAQAQAYLKSQPVTITSQYAEIIYFLRNGNLYRRVLLVAPERQSSVYQVFPFPDFQSPFNIRTSWQGLNDLSAHPSPLGVGDFIILNTLGDLTNREHRFASPRFMNDFTSVGDTKPPVLLPDGVPDDDNGDTVPDYWPSLYPNIIGTALMNEFVPTPAHRNQVFSRAGFTPKDFMAFPYIYPYAYSRPDVNTSPYGWIHSPNPNLKVSAAGTWLAYLNQLNHNPLSAGDSLPNPYNTSGTLASVADPVETYWGFPTWRETMSPSWADPFRDLPRTAQAFGLIPLDPSAAITDTKNFLPAMVTNNPFTNTPIRLVPQLYNDTFGISSYFMNLPVPFAPDGLWKQLWEDDLIMTGVRSFDIKAYDASFGGYVDLGWGNDVRLTAPFDTAAPYLVKSLLSSRVPQYLGPLISGTPHVPTNNGTATGTPFLIWPPKLTSDPTAQFWNLYPETFAHEGRIPPLTWDTQFAAQPYPLNINIGENSPSTIRLRRAWDSWSTDYSNAPANGVNPNTGQPLGPPFTQAIYPSYPPPYPMPLRGLRIQIRVTDPRNEKAKTLTITQDFTDKL